MKVIIHGTDTLHKLDNRAQTPGKTGELSGLELRRVYCAGGVRCSVVHARLHPRNSRWLLEIFTPRWMDHLVSMGRGQTDASIDRPKFGQPLVDRYSKGRERKCVCTRLFNKEIRYLCDKSFLFFEVILESFDFIGMWKCLDDAESRVRGGRVFNYRNFFFI